MFSKRLFLGKKIEKICSYDYSGNSKRGNQVKPIFRDSEGKKWIGKEFSPSSLANDYIAFNLIKMLNLPGIGFPEVKVVEHEDRLWQVYQYIDIKHSYGIGDFFKFLNTQERQIAVLYRIMANVDGNFSNLARDSENKMWVYDFEYSGRFDEYREMSQDVFKVLLLLMRPDLRRIEEYEEGIIAVKKARDSTLTKARLEEIVSDAGYKEPKLTEFVSEIISNADNIGTELNLMIKAWNSCLIERKTRSKRGIPFYVATGHNCGQTALRMGLNAFKFSIRHNLAQLEDLTLKKGNTWTFTAQLAYALSNMDVDFRYYVKEEFCRILEDIVGSFEKNMPRKSFCLAKRYTGFDSLATCINHILKRGEYELRKPTIDDLQREINNNNVVICCVDNSVINGNNKFRYKGHHIVLTHIGSVNVYYHDCGPVQPREDKKVSREVFEKARDMCWFDHGCIVIRGLKDVNYKANIDVLGKKILCTANVNLNLNSYFSVSADEEFDGRLVFEKSENENLSFIENVLKIKSDDASIDFLRKMIYFLADKFLDGVQLVHGAGAVYNQKGVLILGKQNSGKSMAINSISDITIIDDDVLFVDESFMYCAGKKYVSCTLEDGKKCLNLVDKEAEIHRINLVLCLDKKYPGGFAKEISGSVDAGYAHLDFVPEFMQKDYSKTGFIFNAPAYVIGTNENVSETIKIIKDLIEKI